METPVQGPFTFGGTPLINAATNKISASLVPSVLWSQVTSSGTSFTFASITDNYQVFNCGTLTSIVVMARTGIVEAVLTFSTGGTIPTISEMGSYWFYGDDCIAGCFVAVKYRRYQWRVRCLNGFYSIEVAAFPAGTVSKVTGTSVTRALTNGSAYVFKSALTALTLTTASLTTFASVAFRAANTGATFDSMDVTWSGVDCAGGVFTPAAGRGYLLMVLYNSGGNVGTVEYRE